MSLHDKLTLVIDQYIFEQVGIKSDIDVFKIVLDSLEQVKSDYTPRGILNNEVIK